MIELNSIFCKFLNELNKNRIEFRRNWTTPTPNRPISNQFHQFHLNQSVPNQIQFNFSIFLNELNKNRIKLRRNWINFQPIFTQFHQFHLNQSVPHQIQFHFCKSSINLTKNRMKFRANWSNFQPISPISPESIDFQPN